MSKVVAKVSVRAEVQRHSDLIEQTIERLDAERPAIHLALQLADQLGIAVMALRRIGACEHVHKSRRLAVDALAQIEPP